MRTLARVTDPVKLRIRKCVSRNANEPLVKPRYTKLRVVKVSDILKPAVVREKRLNSKDDTRRGQEGQRAHRSSARNLGYPVVNATGSRRRP